MVEILVLWFWVLANAVLIRIMHEGADFDSYWDIKQKYSHDKYVALVSDDREAFAQVVHSENLYWRSRE